MTLPSLQHDFRSFPVQRAANALWSSPKAAILPLPPINGHVTKYPVIELSKEKLVDTHGDAYAGAFLAGLIDGLPIDRCCKKGAYAASIIVQRNGSIFLKEAPPVMMDS